MTDTLAIPALLAGAVVTVAKVWDIIIDPIVGAYSDREFASRGTRRRLMRLAAFVLPVFFVLTFAVPIGTTPLLAAAWVFVAFLLAATGFSFFQVPYNVLPAELVSGYDARTRLLSARVVVLTAAILLYGGGGPALREVGTELFGTDFGGYLFMAIGAAAIFVIAILVTSTVERAARGKAVAPAAPASLAFAEIAPPRDSIASQARRGLTMLRTSKPFRTLLGTFFTQALAAGGMLAGTQYIATWVLGDTDAVTILFVALILPAIIAAPLWASSPAASARSAPTSSPRRSSSSAPSRTSDSWSCRTLDRRADRPRRHRLRRHPGTAALDAARRHRPRRPHQRPRPRWLVQRDVDGR